MNSSLQMLQDGILKIGYDARGILKHVSSSSSSNSSIRRDTMIVRLWVLSKNILNPGYKVFMCDCVFVDGCLSQS